MSKIDLSKANIGDKFRTRNGQILEYRGECLELRDDKYKLIDGKGFILYLFQYGEYLYDEEHGFDLVEQVFDDEKIEREIKSQKEMQEAVGIEYEAELQRRQEVVELAENVWLFKDPEGSYYSAFHDAEIFVKLKTKYLKEGQL